MSSESALTGSRRLHRRRSIRLPGFDYARNGLYYVTIRLLHPDCLFARYDGKWLLYTDAGQVARRFWLDIPTHFPFVRLDAFVVMPDHVHGLLWVVHEAPDGHGALPVGEADDGVARGTPEPGKPSARAPVSPRPGTLSTVIRSYKSAVTRWCGMNGYPQFAWQRNYHEHLVRGHRELQRIRRYIDANPSAGRPPRIRDTFGAAGAS